MNCISKCAGAATLVAWALVGLAPSQAATARVSVEPGSCVPGGTAVAWITLEQASGTTGADFSLLLPSFALPGTARSMDLPEGFLVASHGRPGHVDLSIASADGLPSGQPMTFSVPFTVDHAAEPGVYQLSFNRLQLYDSTPSPVNGTAVTGTLVVTAPSADLDGDGLPDDWERAFFGSTDPTGEDDTDADGVADAEEFLAGTDPTRAESVFAIDHMTVTLGQGTVEMRWLGPADYAYEIQWSDDPLGPDMTWHSVYNPAITIDETGAQWTDDGSLTYQLPQAMNRRFYRVRSHSP